jgi:transcriptional regulator with XRE-family HTH domain
MSLTPTELGRRLRDARLKALLSQDDVGGRLGVARGTVARWEGGTREISFSTLQALAAALETTVSALIAPEPSPLPLAAPSAATVPAWAGPAWERLHALERQSIEQIATTLAEHPEQLPTMLTLLFDGLQAAQDSRAGAVGVLSHLAQVDVDQLTPMAALTLLAELKRQLEGVAPPSATTAS